MYSIYKIISPSNRVYIGQSKNIENRKLNYKWIGKQTARQPLLHKSLLKYGFDNHIFQILEENLTKTQANDREVFYIKEFKSLKLSLNCTNGGNDVSYNIRKAVIKFDLEGNYIEEFLSIIDAANSLNIIPQKIQICLSKKRYYSSGYLWLYKSDFLNGLLPTWNPKTSSRQKPIQQLTITGDLVNEFSSAAQASVKTGILKQSILNNASGFSKTAKGFIWKYKN